MGYFPIRYDSRVAIYEPKMFIRLATGWLALKMCVAQVTERNPIINNFIL